MDATAIECVEKEGLLDKQTNMREEMNGHGKKGDATVLIIDL